MDNMNWSDEVYRLDHVPYKCQFPCVVRILEGIYMETEAETVSAGDIIKLDKHAKIPKVEARFVHSRDDRSWRSDPSSDMGREIFVPLNYQGKVKVINEVKPYNSVQKLAEDLPRFALVTRPFQVETERKEKITLEAGSKVELDRVIPGFKRGGKSEPDKLVMKFQRGGATLVVGVLCNKNGGFQSVPDDKEYTLKEVIESYQLPRKVTFLQNDLRKVYMESLVDVAENMKTFTDTLLLNAVVIKEVLIGHYKPLEESVQVSSGSSENVNHRTLVVLPLDAEFVRELEVQVLQDATEDDYERLSFVVRPSQAVDAVDEMIYVDFARAPGVVMIDDKYDYDYVDSVARNVPLSTQDTERPPPRPPKLKPKPKPSTKPITTTKPTQPATPKTSAPKTAPKPQAKTAQKSTTTPGNDEAGRDSYYYMGSMTMGKNKSPPHRNKPEDDGAGDYVQPDFNLADIDFSTGTKATKKPSFLSKVKDKLYVNHKEAKNVGHSPTSPHAPSPTKVLPPVPSLTKVLPQAPPPCKVQPPLPSPSKSNYDDDDDLDAYEDIDESQIFPTHAQGGHASGQHGTDKPRAVVAPSMARPTERGGFETLTVSQLYDRLVKCNMRKLAEVCEEESLDGSFIVNIDITTFKQDPFSLTDFELKKLERIKQNWVPK